MVNEESTIIGRFGQFVIWNMNDKTQNFSTAKISIDKSGYLLLDNDMVPALEEEISNLQNDLITEREFQKIQNQMESNFIQSNSRMHDFI